MGQDFEYYRLLSYFTGASSFIVFLILYKWTLGDRFNKGLLGFLILFIYFVNIGLLITALLLYIHSAQLDFEPKFKEYLKTAHIYSSCGVYVGMRGYQARSSGQPTFSLDDGSYIIGKGRADYNFVLNPLKENDRICAKYVIMPYFSRKAGEKNIIELTKEEKVNR